MPLIYKIEEEHYQLGVWEITENESFFITKLGFCALKKAMLKKVQYLASRLILNVLDPKFEMSKMDTWSQDKPLYLDSHYFFNISHSGNFAAAILSKDKDVGVDIELISNRITAIKTHFLNTKELEFVEVFQQADQTEVTALCWAIKEAVLKWTGNASLDYKNNISIMAFKPKNTGIIEVNLHQMNTSFIKVNYFKYGAYWIAYCF
jgi:4'-phosphopantetheinyl transferase